MEFENVYTWAKTIFENYTAMFDFFITDRIDLLGLNLSVFDIILGGGIIAIVGFIIAKWIIDILP